MKTTYDKLISYANYAAQWLDKGDNKNTKLGYAIERFGKKYPKYIKPYQEILEELQVKVNDVYTDFASEDAQKNIMRLIIKDDKGKVTHTENHYTRENTKLRDAEIRKINKEYNDIITSFLETELEIEPYYSPSVPKNLTPLELEYFTGIIIEPKLEVSLNGHSKELQEAQIKN